MADMSIDQLNEKLMALRPKLENYAKLLVERGVALKEGQELVVSSPVENADFAKMLVAAGYAAGASHVTVIWSDDDIMRMDYENAPLEFFQNTPTWKIEQMNSLAAAGACFLTLLGSDPAALRGIDPAKPAAAMLSRNTQCDVWRHGIDFGDNAWCLAGVSGRAWAKTVFPDLDANSATLKLWESILEASRAMGDDPIADWAQHDKNFATNKSKLNDYRFGSLHYKASNGTDLVVGLPEKHLWGGGSHMTNDGTVFIPNIPTEEVFTAPHRLRADGIVYASMPLAHQGQIVDGFWFRLEGGRVVDYGAEEGQEVLKHIFEMDEGASRLGELALISKNTPIRESGVLYYNTLFDENASCHIALGRGYRDNMEGSEDKSTDELIEEGLNDSRAHVDFMIGTDDLSIVGTTATGEEVVVFENGQWAWE